MKLSSLFGTPSVYWRMFKANEWSYSFGLAGLEGLIQPYATIDIPAGITNYDIPANGAQIELKDGGALGRLYLGADKNFLVNRADHWVIEKKPGTTGAQLRHYLPPQLAIVAPVAGATLGQLRIGQSEPVRLGLTFNDVAALKFEGAYDAAGWINDVEAWIMVRQAGQADLAIREVRARARLDPARPDYVEFEADLFNPGGRMPRPGAAEIWAELRSNNSAKHFTSASVRVTIADTARRSYLVEFNGQAGNPLRFAAPPAGGSIAVTLWHAAPAFMNNVRIATSLDNYMSRIPAIYRGIEAHNGAQMHRWEVGLAVPPNTVPWTRILSVIDVDLFGRETQNDTDFRLDDTTPPTIAISEPIAGQPLVAADNLSAANPLRLVVRGRVTDTQAGVKAGSLRYVRNGAATPIDGVDGQGNWTFQTDITEIGPYDFTIEAEDNSGNVGRSNLQVSVVRSFRPRSQQELLSTTAYLNELLRFTSFQLRLGGGAVNPDNLRAAFVQPFAEIAEARSAWARRPQADLLTPVRLLRVQNGIDSAGLVARWTFDELAQGAGDGLRNRAGRLPLNGRFRGPDRDAANIRRMTGAAGSDFEGALALDGECWAEVAHSPYLDVAGKNRDFSVSLWVYPQGGGTGTWRQILYKGHDEPPRRRGAALNRSFSMWLHPDSNKVHFRISTSAPNDGGDSRSQLAAGQWSHLLYVKHGGLLQLYINGVLDAEVVLQGAVVSNTDPLYIGKSPYFPSFLGGLDDVRIYATALDPASAALLATNRNAPLAPDPIDHYHRIAYETLLRSNGTSLEEIAQLPALGAEQREALAERLGLGVPGTDAAGLLATPFAYGSTEFETFLSGTFGLPRSDLMTGDPLADQENGWFAYRQRERLAYRWALEDADRVGVPDLDPDIVSQDDLAPDAVEWRRLLLLRQAELARTHAGLVGQLQSSSSVRQAFEVAYSADEYEKLLDIETQEAVGDPIEPLIAPFALDNARFRKLVAYARYCGIAGGRMQVLSLSAAEDLAHLLVQSWKLRQRHGAWQAEEAALATKLWPVATAGPAWMGKSGNATFPPWRGDASARLALEDRLGIRLREWQAIEDQRVQATADAQRAGLPALRDALLGMAELPAAQRLYNSLTQRWLLDFGASAAEFLTPAQQAAGSLQSLLNGIRGGWFEDGHPAAAWQLAATLPEFDKRWARIGTEVSWQASVLNFLYPENVLYPELRGNNSPELSALLNELEKIRPFTPDDLRQLTGLIQNISRARASDPLELNLLLPMAIGLAFQRSRYSAAALDEYRKVYDWTRSTVAQRKLVRPLLDEPDNQAPLARFSNPDWIALLDDPHKIVTAGQSGARNPYTRFVLFQILQCLLDQADEAFAAGSADQRTLALQLYREAAQILDFDELRERQPDSGDEAYLPNPVVSARQAHVAAALAKLRAGLTWLGTPQPPDLTQGNEQGVLQGLVRPTPYRFRVLLDRARQLAQFAQQVESQYLAALEAGDRAIEQLLSSGAATDVAQQNVELRNLQHVEAATGRDVVALQNMGSQIQRDRYREWIASGPNYFERARLDAMWTANTWRQVENVAGTAASVAGAVQSAIGVEGVLKIASTTALIAGTAMAGVARGFAIDAQTRADVNAIQGSQQRRLDEWELQADMAAQDVAVTAAQLRQADDRIAIAEKETAIAQTQLIQAQQMLAFIRNKTTNAAFYQWLTGELGQIYATILRLATSTARQAEGQLAFERQERTIGYIRSDYWQLANASAAAASAQGQGQLPVEAKGITGSARLMQDIALLDDHAFASDQRRLNLTQSFSLARLMPAEFEEFRRTGKLGFITAMGWFDDGFPGHYMRLINRVRLSVAALVPPVQGIRATLANTGISRLVTGDPGFPTVVLNQPPQLVALTSPIATSGVFELDVQGDLLLPFEGIGVETGWSLEVPRAGNVFDFDTLVDVVVTMDYTALHSPEVRERVVRAQPRRTSGELLLSLRRDFPDVWYELANSAKPDLQFDMPISARNFPSGFIEPRVTELALSSRSLDGKDCAFTARFTIGSVQSDEIRSINGLASSRQAAAASLRPVIAQIASGAMPLQLRIEFGDVAAVSPADPPPFTQMIRAGNISDVLIVFTIEGQRPAW